MACINRNTSEFQALKQQFKTDVKTENVIDTWQKLNKSQEFPSLAEALTMTKQQEALFSLKTREFSDALLGNIDRLGYGSMYKGKFYINNSERTTWDQSTWSYNESVLQKNLTLTKRYLRINNIPEEAVTFRRTDRAYEVIVQDNVFTPKDIIKAQENNKSTHSVQLVQHLANLFPQINVEVVTVKEAKEYYKSLPESQKSKVPFDKIRSFYVNGNAVLIKGRVSNETAIEEILHPFVDGLLVDNTELFNKLLSEAKQNFPVLNQEIEDAYTDRRGFTQRHRNLELVTQALSRHFNNEYETNPTRSFKDVIRDFLKWFSEIIKNFSQYLTGRPMQFKASSLTMNTKLSDIARLLNTSDIEFKLERVADNKVRYNFTPEKKAIIDYAIGQTVNSKQEEVIKRLFNLAQSVEQEVDTLSVSAKEDADTLVILNEKDHTYLDIINGKDYLSTTQVIKGKMTPEQQAENQLNLDIGNEFDMILDAIVSDKSFDEIKENIKFLDPVKAQAAYKTMEANVRMLTTDGAVAIPQVVLYDKETGIAGTADLVIVTRTGALRVIDLKTSKNFVRNNEQYDKNWDLKDDSFLKRKGVDKLSTRQQHNLQVNLYRRMLENMGYEVDQSEFSTSTFHIKVDITGKGKNQKFNGDFEFDTWMPHPVSQNVDMVNKLIPLFIDPVAKDEIDAADELSDDARITQDDILDPSEQMSDDTLDANGLTEYATISGALDSYEIALIKKEDAIDKIESSIFMDRTAAETKENIQHTLAAISVAKGEGPKARSALYTRLLRDGLRSVENFTKYVTDPSNFNKPEFIGYVLNFNRFIETYRGLFSIQQSGDLNATQRTLVLNFQLELNKLVGNESTEGLVDESITNYVREVIKGRSSRDFSKEDLNDLMAMGQDISMTEYLTGDMATSGDTILAVMDKIYKSKKQELLDKLEERDDLIRKKASKLQRLSPGTDPQKLYHFMLEFGEDGVPTGRYVGKTGQLYSNTEQELRDKLMDDNGQWKEYRDVTDVTTANPRDVEWNKQLANDKSAYASFWRAETRGLGNSPVSGEYHTYTEEFKRERRKYEYFVPTGEHGYWKKRSTVSARVYAQYQAKYFDKREYTKAVRKNGVPTGQVVFGQTIATVKPEFKTTRESRRSDGKSLLSEKYESIMNPTDELGRAQKDFYETFVRLYEKELLAKLPMGQRGQMLGRVPLIKARLYQNLKEKPNLVTRLWSKMSRGVENLITETAQQKVVLTDEQGNLVDQLPIFYTGKPATEKDMADVQAQIDQLNDKKKEGLINPTRFTEEMKILKGRLASLQNAPTLGELNLDLGTALIKFNAMAEHYETMGQVEDTMKAMIKVLEKREYQPSGDTKLYKYVNGKRIKTGQKKDVESNIVRRAKKWMSMVYYDNEQMTRGFLEKLTDGLISYSSLSYVAFNPFGNFNNYVLGKLNNNIEMLGGRFFSKKAYHRAVYEFNKRGLTDLVRRTAQSNTLNELGDIATGNAFNFSKDSAYNPQKPLSKYEGFVDLFRMMDDKTDIRESGRQGEKAYKSWFAKATEFGYILQDAAEYNVQTKVGMAMLMDTTIKNPETGETLSLYDAFEFDGEKQENVLKKGFTKIVQKNGNEVDYNDQFRYDLRNKIRETNKQIHGNYAREDRMVMQSHAVGRLAAQFHKWVAPAIKARFRREYFDENLGWMEGRYKSFYSFLKYSLNEIKKGELAFTKYGKGFKESYGFKGDGSQNDQRAENKLFNTYRTLGEIGIIFTTLAVSQILAALFANDDDDSDFERRLENFLRYQADRTYKELILFVPVAPDAWTQMYQMMKSPIPATRTLGEFGEAMSLTVRTPIAMLVQGEEIYGDSKYVYQRGTRAGEFKINKNWKDAIPLIYAIQKWDNYIQESNFFIK